MPIFEFEEFIPNKGDEYCNYWGYVTYNYFSPKTGYSISGQLGLVADEVTRNIITYGFADGKKHSVDVRIVSSENLIIRIRDDCKEFDPEKYIAQFHSDDPAKNVGLKILVGMAKKISYQNNAGINTLLVTV